MSGTARPAYERRPPNLRACELMPLGELRRWIRGLVRVCERVVADASAPRHLRTLAGRILTRLPAARRAIAFGGRRTVTAEVASWRRQLAGRVREVRGRRSGFEISDLRFQKKNPEHRFQLRTRRESRCPDL